MRFIRQTNHESGFGAIAYVLIAIVLMAALTGALSISGSSATKQAGLDRARSELYAQAQFIANAIRDCPSTYGFTAGLASQSRGFPEEVGSFNGYNTAAAVNVSDIICPGNIDSTGAEATVFGVDWLLPQSIAGFGPWQYVHDNQGVSIGIKLDGTQPPVFQSNVVGITNARFAPNETAGDVNDDTIGCNNNNVFILYIARGSAGIDHCSYY